ncbi:unnamed protein product, partial [Polarella glacialis]
LLWLSPVAQDVLRTSSQLLCGAVPSPSSKLAAALRQATDEQCFGLLKDASFRSELAKALEGSGVKEISNKTAAELVEVAGKVLQGRSEAIKAKAQPIIKAMPSGVPSYSEVVKLLPKGEQPCEALRRDWLLWHSVGCAHDSKQLPALAATAAVERAGIAACAGSGPVVDCVLGLHVLERISEYAAWEASIPGSNSKVSAKEVKFPFEGVAAKEVSLRRVLGNALPPAVADTCAVQVTGGKEVKAVLQALADAAKKAAVMPLYAAPPAVKEPKDKKEGKDSAKDEAAPAAKRAAPSAAPCAEGGVQKIHKATATQELQQLLLAYRLRPRTVVGEAVMGPVSGGGAAGNAGGGAVAGGYVAHGEQPKGFAGLWAPVGNQIPPGHTPYSWMHEKALGMKEGFPCLWQPIAGAVSGSCPPGHTNYSWEKAIAGSAGGPTPSSSASAKAPKAKETPQAAKAEAGGKAPAAAPAAPKKATAPAATDAAAEGSDEAALAKLDIRVGRILEVGRVPDADSLFLLKVNIGDPTPRQVVTGLVKHYKEEELKDRQVMVYCNIKPGKLKGFESQAMVLAATSEKGTETEKCELISPPKGAVEGTRPLCGSLEVGSGSEGVSVKNISKVWAQVQPLLKTNDKGEATFKGTPLTLKEGAVTSGLKGVGIY